MHIQMSAVISLTPEIFQPHQVDKHHPPQRLLQKQRPDLVTGAPLEENLTRPNHPSSLVLRKLA
jgi:hypothetical protein